MRKPTAIIAGLIVIFLILWVPGRKPAELEGVLEVSFERAAFYPNGSCWRKPYWLHLSTSDLTEHDQQLLIAARSKNGGIFSGAYQVKLIGELSHVGVWGHLGKYFREVRPYCFRSSSLFRAAARFELLA
jgi:hypothetical protein